MEVKVDEFVALVMGQRKDPDSDRKITSSQKIVKELKKRKYVDLSPGFQESLNVLQPNQHSLGWLEVLHVWMDANPEFFLEKCAIFLQSCAGDQIRCSAAKFVEVCSAYAKYALTTPNFPIMSAIIPLRTAVLALRERPGQLTGVHNEFVKLCVKAKCYTAALPLLDEVIDTLPTGDKDNKIEPLHVLSYYYYGGMVYEALKQFDRALECFSVVMSVPADVMSKVMVEAYKKYLLVSLLQHGRFVDLPQYAVFAQRQLKTLTNPYQDFVSAFKNGNVDKFREQMGKHVDILQADNNYGLAKQVAAKMVHRNIKKLTEIYMTLSLKAIAEQVKLPDEKATELALLSMIDSNEIHATIDQISGTVSFHDDSERFDTEETMKMLQAEVDEASRILSKVTALDAALRVSPKYIKKTMKLNDGTGGSFDMDFEPGHPAF